MKKSSIWKSALAVVAVAFAVAFTPKEKEEDCKYYAHCESHEWMGDVRENKDDAAQDWQDHLQKWPEEQHEGQVKMDCDGQGHMENKDHDRGDQGHSPWNKQGNDMNHE
ncbi:hypothetical protein [Persicobacter psychrovividus]|uniref:Uncharacterized protein n=1 Tax=Persicobacter psychrovividus TaxID=387638 RepID=A0ABM7VDD1_9BACT|nr:hypothetical protein PEPS_10550 [Persicobacter psychrovividus]